MDKVRQSGGQVRTVIEMSKERNRRKFVWDEESLHMLTGIVSLKVINGVISSCLERSRKGKKDKTRLFSNMKSLKYIQSQWRKNLEKV